MLSTASRLAVLSLVISAVTTTRASALPAALSATRDAAVDALRDNGAQLDIRPMAHGGVSRLHESAVRFVGADARSAGRDEIGSPVEIPGFSSAVAKNSESDETSSGGEKRQRSLEGLGGPCASHQQGSVHSTGSEMAFDVGRRGVADRRMLKGMDDDAAMDGAVHSVGDRASDIRDTHDIDVQLEAIQVEGDASGLRDDRDGAEEPELKSADGAGGGEGEGDSEGDVGWWQRFKERVGVKTIATLLFIGYLSGKILPLFLCYKLWRRRRNARYARLNQDDLSGEGVVGAADEAGTMVVGADGRTVDEYREYGALADAEQGRGGDGLRGAESHGRKADTEVERHPQAGRGTEDGKPGGKQDGRRSERQAGEGVASTERAPLLGSAPASRAV